MEFLLSLAMFAVGSYVGYKYYKNRKPAPEPYVMPELDEVRIEDPPEALFRTDDEATNEPVMLKKVAEEKAEAPAKEKAPSKRKPKIEISK